MTPSPTARLEERWHRYAGSRRRRPGQATPMSFPRLPRPIQFMVRYAAAAAGAAYALTIGVATGRGRRAIAHLAADFGVSGRPSPQLPRIGPDAITADCTAVEMRASAGTDG